MSGRFYSDIHSKILRVVPTITLLVVCAAAVRDAKAQAATPAPAPTSLWLSADARTVPVGQKLHGGLLTRELVRQAVLMAAREELGATARDEGLGDPPPENAGSGSIAWRIHVVTPRPNRFRIELSSIDKTPEVRVFTKAFDVDPDPARYYASMLPILERESRTALVDALKKAGLTNQRKKPGEQKPDMTRIDELLSNMDFVSQFAAVRLARGQIGELGESPELLQRLVRGYSHLAVLTQHFWNVTSDIYAARALLYAERLYAASEQSPAALSHRVYARALCGTHALALADIAAMRNPGGPIERSAPLAPPWIGIFEAYCHFDRATLQAAAAEVPSMAPLAKLLIAQINDAQGDNAQLVKLIPAAIDDLPEAYGIFRPLMNQTSLGARTRASHATLQNFKRRLPMRLRDTPEIPQAVRDLATAETQKQSAAAAENPLGFGANSLFSKLPAQLADEISRAADESAASEPSWRALAGMIREEAFVGTAVYLYHVQPIAATQPVQDSASLYVAGHRYERMIRSFTFARADRQSDEYNRLIGDVKIVDPNLAMWRLYIRMWYVLSGNRYLGSTGFKEALDQRNLTCEYLVACVRLGEQALRTNRTDESVQQYDRALTLIQQISPYCPVAVRAAMEQVKEPTADQFAAWEKIAADDARASRSLGWRYRQMSRLDDATRLLEQSLAISPSDGALTDLAEVYRLNGREDLLEPALARFLTKDDAGAMEARVRDRLAHGHIARGEWRLAEADALAAAESGEPWAMTTASEVYEGLQDWTKSEEYIRRVSNASLGSGQVNWYFWCRRTGRGDLEAARTRARQFVDAPREEVSEATASLGVFALLEGNIGGALPYFRAAWDRTPQSDYYGLHFVLLLAEQKNEADTERALITLLNQTKADDAKTPAHIRESVRLVVDQLASGEKPPLSVDALVTALDGMDRSARTNYGYFFGRLAELAGDKATAERCYRKSFEGGLFRHFNATLAAVRLKALAQVEQ